MFAHLQPHPAPIDAELRDGLIRIVHDHGTLDDVASDGMHTRSKDQIGLLAVGEPQSQGSHVAEIMARPQSSMPHRICIRVPSGLDVAA
jgi:hypothetical protein